MTTPLPVATGRESLRYVWNISRPYRGRLLLVLLLGIVSATAGLVAPIAIGVLVDAAQDSTASAWTVAWMVAIMVVAAVLGAIGAATTIVVAARSITRSLPHFASDSSHARWRCRRVSWNAPAPAISSHAQATTSHRSQTPHPPSSQRSR